MKEVKVGDRITLSEAFGWATATVLSVSGGEVGVGNVMSTYQVEIDGVADENTAKALDENHAKIKGSSRRLISGKDIAGLA